MSATEQKDEAEPEFESCPEIDEDFFRKMEESGAFLTVDSWEPDETKEVKTEIKEEPKDSSRSDRSASKDSKSRTRDRDRSERDRGRDRDKDSRDRDRDRDRRRRSPERPKRPRYSPPRRSRSPPRRYPLSRQDSRPDRHQQASKRPSFLDEITAKFPELQNGQQQNFVMNQQPNAFGPPPLMMINPMNQMVNPNFMPGPMHMQGAPFMQQHQFNQNGPMPPMMISDQFQPPQHQPFQNIVPVAAPNPLNNPLIAPGTYVPPQPVPSPILTPFQASEPAASTSRASLLDEVAAPARRKEESSQLTAKKNLESLPLIDMLKKISEAKSRESSEAARSEKVREAINLLDELPLKEPRLPFVFNLSGKALSPIRSDPEMKLRSPLVISDHNPMFLSQAREEDCRDAMLANPVRNITGELFDFARNLGLDLVEISEKVRDYKDPGAATDLKPQTQAQAKPPAATQIVSQAKKKMVPQIKPQVLPQVKNQVVAQAKPREFPADISNNFIDLTARKSHQSVQTMFNACDECEARSRKKFASKGAQCEMAVAGPEPKADEPGSFKANFDAATMNAISETQRQALAKFCQAFNLYPDTFGLLTEPIGRLVKAEKRAPPAVLEDLAAYTNPENPNQPDFVSFSPVRPVRESPKAAAFLRFDPSPYGAGRNPSRSNSRSPIRQPFDDSPLVERRSRSFSRSPNSRNGRSGYGLNNFDARSFDRSPPHLSRSRSPRGMRSQSPRDGYQSRYHFDSSPRRPSIIERLGNKVPSPLEDYMAPRPPYLDQGTSSHYQGSSHFTETRPYRIPSPRNRRPSLEYREGNSFERGRPRSRSISPRRRSPVYRQPPTSRRGRF